MHFYKAVFHLLEFKKSHQQYCTCDQGRAAKVAHPRSKKLADPSISSPLGLSPPSVCCTAV